MKLIFCSECYDLRRLDLCRETRCNCGESFGKYVEGIHAIYGGKAIPIGIANSTLVSALQQRELWNKQTGVDFKAFVIPSTCKTFEKIDK